MAFQTCDTRTFGLYLTSISDVARILAYMRLGNRSKMSGLVWSLVAIVAER